jgi:subtilisin family serine protease
MIAVAATDSNDDKATFSNYGDWVNLAAPGVDILSLRAGGTSMGTTYGDYLTVASGTSMACPHVAGACALLISTNPSLTSDDVNDILTQTGDPILPGICASNGRLNIFNAILVSTTSQGVISLDRDYYSCSSVINIWLTDSDLSDNNSQDVNLVASGGDLETVLLTKKIPTVGIFTGSISISSGELNSQDGVVQVSHGQVITVTYEDANDGTGSPATVTDTATTDCQSPVISNVQIDVPGPEPKVSFDTNEPTVAKVFYGGKLYRPRCFYEN